MDIDGIKVFRHEGMFFGVISLMDNMATTVPVHTRLIWSRDGLIWNRLPDRQNFIENGAPGEWDSGSVAFQSIVPDGDRFRIYYKGGNRTQKFWGREGETDIPRSGGTGLAYIGRNRFIGVQGGQEGGYLLTRQFVLAGNRIEINCRAHVERPAQGLESQIKAELLGPVNGHEPTTAYPGFSMQECDPIAVDDQYHQVITWNGDPDISDLQGKPIYIRFFIRNATLYTLKVNDIST